MKLVHHFCRNMRPLSSLCLILGLLFVTAACDANGQDQGTHDATHTAIQEVQWGPTSFGPEASPVSGDFAAGQHITYIRMPGALATPLHAHTHSYVGIVVKGTMRHWLPGFSETEKDLPAGSHWFMPANAKHVSECLEGSECIAAIFQDDFFDFNPVDEN